MVYSDMDQGQIGSMKTLGITESYQVKRQILLSASEAAEMILRVDDIIKSAPRFVLITFMTPGLEKIKAKKLTVDFEFHKSYCRFKILYGLE